MNFNAGDSINELRIRGDGELVPDKALGRRTLVDVSRSRFKRHVRIVDVGGEVRGVDCRIIRFRTQLLAYLVTGSELIPTGGYCVLEIGFCLRNARLPVLQFGNVCAHSNCSPIVPLGTFLARVQAIL